MIAVLVVIAIVAVNIIFFDEEENRDD